MKMGYSVAMCTYNGEKYIRRQIDSILNQIIKPNEIIICDDGSTDKTKEILADYQTQYPELFKIHHNKENLRSVKNFEKAILLCTQDIIFLSDQDDIWAENKAEKMLQYFEKNPNIDALATNGYCIDKNGNIHEKYSVWDIPHFFRELGLPTNYYEMITYAGNIATGASMAFRANIKQRIIPFPIIEDYHHDEWIATITSQNGNFELLNDKLFYYRIHDEQQVGGVFFDKTDREKQNLINWFNLYSKNDSFTDYKKKLKRLSCSYKRLELIKKHSSISPINDINIIKNKYFELKQECINHFPIRSKLLFFLDKITGKRQIK